MKRGESLSLDSGRGRLVVTLANDGELAARLEKGESMGWIFRLEERLEEAHDLEVILTGGKRTVRLETRVKQVFRSGKDLHGTMLEVLSQHEEDQREVSTATTRIGSVADPPTVDQERPVKRVGETLGASSVFDIKKLDPPAKVRLAAKATRPQRQILLRDSSAQIALSLLNNPQIEAKEVVELAKNPQSASGVLQRIARDRRWSGNYEILLALVKNPRTPSPLAVRFVDQLRKGDLRDLAKSQALRENVRKAILRVYLKRG